MKDRLQLTIAAPSSPPRRTRTARHKALLFAMLCAPPVGVHAASPKEIAEARRGYYGLLGLEMDSLVAMVKGETDYDADKATAHARDMLAADRIQRGRHAGRSAADGGRAWPPGLRPSSPRARSCSTCCGWPVRPTWFGWA